MKEQLILRNHIKDVRSEKKLSQSQLAELVGVSRNTISSIETGQFNPTAKLALILCIALDKNLKSFSILNKPIFKFIITKKILSAYPSLICSRIFFFYLCITYVFHTVSDSSFAIRCILLLCWYALLQ